MYRCSRLTHHLRLTPLARDASSAFADKQFGSLKLEPRVHSKSYIV